MSEPLRPAGGLARAGSDLLGHLFYLMPVEEGEFLSPSLLGPSFSHAHPLSSSGFQSHAGSSFLQRD